jgi:hypothetical protein
MTKRSRMTGDFLPDKTRRLSHTPRTLVQEQILLTSRVMQVLPPPSGELNKTSVAKIQTMGSALAPTG